MPRAGEIGTPAGRNEGRFESDIHWLNAEGLILTPVSWALTSPDTGINLSFGSDSTWTRELPVWFQKKIYNWSDSQMQM